MLPKSERSASMIRIRSAYLIGIDVWQTGQAKVPFAVKPASKPGSRVCELVNPTYINLATGELSGKVYRVEYRFHGFPGGCRAIHECEPTLPEFWKGKVDATYIDAYGEMDYLVWQAIARLKPEAVHELIGMEGLESRNRQNELLAAVFPKCTGVRIEGGEGSETSFSSVLYIEPEEASSAQFGSLENYAASIRDWLGQARGTAQSHYLGDVILTHAIGYGVPSVRMLAVGVKPLDYQSTDTNVNVPKSVMDIVLRYGYLQQLRHLVGRLQGLTFHKYSIAEYYSRLGKSDNQIAANYQKTFLLDREEDLSERLQVVQTADEIKHLCTTDYVSLLRDSPYSRQIETGSLEPHVAAYAYSVLADLERKIVDAEKKVYDVTKLIHERAVALGELLRDVSTAYTNSSNLALQRWIRALTLLTVGASLLALVFGVLLNRS
jgi:hypothetical protein